jgi:hypothetical protein
MLIDVIMAIHVHLLESMGQARDYFLISISFSVLFLILDSNPFLTTTSERGSRVLKLSTEMPAVKYHGSPSLDHQIAAIEVSEKLMKGSLFDG